MTLWFPPTPSPRPLELSEVANTVKAELKDIPTVDSVLARISKNESHLITCLEWFCCIQGKLEWDEKHSTEIADKTSLELWSVAKQEKWLRNFLLRHLLLDSILENSLAKSIITTFFLICDQLPDPNKLIEIVAGIVLDCKLFDENQFNNQYQSKKLIDVNKLSILAYKYQLTREIILDLIRNELKIYQINLSNFVDGVVEFFNDNASLNSDPESIEGLENWLLRCLKEEIGTTQGIAVSKILLSVPKETGSQFPKLVVWLKENYGKGEKVNYLTQEAKQKLREWIGAINYGDFATLVNLLLSNLSGIPDYQRNQLEKRMYFWGNYSDRFEQIRIFIPSSSKYAIGSSLKSDVTILQPDGISESTEICAFDFGTHIVVEFFRGKGSETRLFDCRLSSNIRQTLFSSNDLTISRIRKLGGQTHDHVFLWQYYCERWLAKQNIFPNPNIRRFKSSHNQDYPYDPISGMPSIEYNKKLERDRKLVKWEEEMRSLRN